MDLSWWVAVSLIRAVRPSLLRPRHCYDPITRPAPRRTLTCSANNAASPPGTIDLHGLYVKEAIEKVEEFISAEQRAGQHPELRVIVGKGIHSPGHVAKIKPAVEELMRK